MSIEVLNVRGVMIPHRVIPIIGDGACLFRGLSYLLYDTQVMAREIREEIVDHIVQNWNEFCVMTHDPNGDNYSSAEIYYTEMIRPNTYGGLSELFAAAQIYGYVFEVYRNGVLYVTSGQEGNPIGRLRFTSNLSSGHFDVYLPCANENLPSPTFIGPNEELNPIELGTLLTSPTLTPEVPVSQIHSQSCVVTLDPDSNSPTFTQPNENKLNSIKLRTTPLTSPTEDLYSIELGTSLTSSTFTPEVPVSQINSQSCVVTLDPDSNSPTFTQPNENKLNSIKLRTVPLTSPTFTPEITISQLEAQSYVIYNTNSPACKPPNNNNCNPIDLGSISLISPSFTPENPVPASQLYLSVDNTSPTYTQSNVPIAVLEMRQSQPTKKQRVRFTDAIRKKQLRKAAKKYVSNNPQVHRSSVSMYQQNHPEAHRVAAAKFQKSNPELHRTAVANFQKNNPELHRQRTARYDSQNSNTRHERRMRTWNVKKNSGMSYDHNIDYEHDIMVALGTMSLECIHCHALKWKNESPGMCCSEGKTHLPHFEPQPDPLYSLIRDLHPDHVHFMDRVRKYNNSFQMTSFGAKQVKEYGFMPTFKVQGQVYHLIGSLQPQSEQNPQFLQIYFVGEDEREARIRCNNIPDLKQTLVKQLQIMLHQNNPYVKDLKTTIEKAPPHSNFSVVIHADRKQADAHRGRYNAPTCSEVALVIVGQQFDKRDIIIQRHDDKLKRISELHRAYDALQYPLLFCRGEDGYSIDIAQVYPITKTPNHQKTVSAMNFYAYRIMCRRADDNHLFYYRALFNQYLVDMYAKIETERLNYIRSHQTQLRADSYIHLRDAIGRQDTELTELGQVVVLPSSFTGSPRYMHEKTQDAMTYVRHYGRPDLFITFTCNPHWTEITDALLPGQQPHDRQDIIARVFHLKVKALLSLLRKGELFGKVRCFIYSVEWQKRGLPHIHLLLWLQQSITPDQIDNVISAEIPDPDQDPLLYEIVKANMIHGPCGSFNYKSPCMKAGKCTKKYPRPLLQETQTAGDGYPMYRRRSVEDGGFTVEINGVTLDNRWVVPYNPVLLRTFKGHINVECCNSIKSIKYVCKYVTKGSDQATFGLENERDETIMYESGRYISSSEAVWRILSFSIHERFPAVFHLAVHLENGQRIYFNQNETIRLTNVITNPPNTTLTAFFNLCNVDSFAKTLLYCEVPSYYVWKNNRFERRKRGVEVAGWPGVKKEHVLGRVYTIHPNNTECYYLRLLLHEIRGPTSFLDLKTVNGITEPTFQAACKALGLTDDESHWDAALEEAVLCESPIRLRDLFAVMLIFCQLTDAAKLWDKYKDYFSEDIRREMEAQLNDGDINFVLDEVYNKCLLCLENTVLSLGGDHLQKYGLPQPVTSHEAGIINRDYLCEINYDINNLAEIVINNENMLNDEQSCVYHNVLESIERADGQIYFLDAPGGTGKTFLINLLLAKIRKDRNIALAVASSGIAATLLEGGKTAHSMFKLPFNLMLHDSPTCNIPKDSSMVQVLKECKLIIWDECTMSPKGGFEALDRTLKDLRKDDRLMGGLTVLLAGDFRQTLPVVPRGTRADEVKACLKSSNLWPFIRILSLHTNMRVHLRGDESAATFAKILLDIGDGNYSSVDGKIIIPPNLSKVVSTVPELINAIYPDIENIQNKSTEWLCERAILTPKNDNATAINQLILDSFQAHAVQYKSLDSVLEKNEATNYPIEFLNSLNPSGLPPHILTLKVGAPVMLIRNIKPPKMCNGTRLRIKHLHKNVIEATIITGCGRGEIVFIPRIPIVPSDFPFQFKRIQFPLKLCFSMTINKSQGQSLKIAGIDLREDCFSHGQLYVACSRVSSAGGLVILAPDGRTTNVVYKEVLR